LICISLLHLNCFFFVLIGGCRYYENIFDNILAEGYYRDMKDSVSSNLARNIKRLRDLRGLTQTQLSHLSDLPRPTWANLESGAANPTLAVLLRVAETLQVSLEELITTPRASYKFFAASEIQVQRRGEATIRKMLPEGLPGMEFDRFELSAGARMAGIPHRDGTREYLTCESGSIELGVAGERFLLHPGDVVAFRGDQRHSYRNPKSSKAVGYSVVVLSPGQF
jgi:transcriptional regulator with XRE-family HTH domain